MRTSFFEYNCHFSNKDKLLEERNKYRIYCKCGHSMVFYPFEKTNKKICSHCGYYVYKNKKIEFNEKIKSLLLKENFKIEGVYQ